MKRVNAVDLSRSRITAAAKVGRREVGAELDPPVDGGGEGVKLVVL